jgi:transcriptional regulator
MHPAEAFKVDDAAALTSWLSAHPFVTLAAAPMGRPLIAHVPALLRRDGEGLALDFHLSRSNTLAPFMAQGFAAVAVSLGPDAYVSPDWYVSEDQVPTWNYVTVEAEGPVSVLGEADLVRLLDDLSAQEEARLSPKPVWTRDKMSPGRFEGMLRGIVGGPQAVETLEGTFKLTQNKPFSQDLTVFGRYQVVVSFYAQSKKGAVTYKGTNSVFVDLAELRDVTVPYQAP